MTDNVHEAIAVIDEFNATYENEYKDLSDIEDLLEAALKLADAYNELQAAYEHSEWLRLRHGEVSTRQFGG
jgi:hypothetical protein